MSMKISTLSGIHRNFKRPCPLCNYFGLWPTELWSCYSWRYTIRHSVWSSKDGRMPRLTVQRPPLPIASMRLSQ